MIPIYRKAGACASALILSAVLAAGANADHVVFYDVAVFSGDEELIDFEGLGGQGTPVPSVGDVSFALEPSGIAPRASVQDPAPRPFGPQGIGAIDPAAAGAPFNPYDDLVVTFSGPVNRMGFVISANTGTVIDITVSCVVEGVVVDSFVFPDATSPGFNFYGFQTDEPFDEVVIEVGNTVGAGFWRIDNLRYEFAPPNLAPISDAGSDQSIRAGDTVVLDGSGSFDDNTPSASLLYAWSFASIPAGSSAVLSGADTVAPSFLADVAGTYLVDLVVTDEGFLPSLADQVQVSSDNLAPAAAAGNDQLVLVGTTANLDGSGSTDPELDPLTYAWSFLSTPAGSTASIANDTQVAASFTADLEGSYEVNLTVSDFIGPGAPDTVQITAAAAEEYSEFQIVSASGVVDSLTSGQVTTGGNQNALLNFLSQAVVAIQQGDISEAINKLDKALLRTDGCVLRGSPDGNGSGRDWITDCDAQIETYGLLSDALSALSP